MDQAKDASTRFLSALQAKPYHPVIKCVLSREPYNRQEVICLAQCFLHYCCGCGKSRTECTEPLMRCSDCEFAHFCSVRSLFVPDNFARLPSSGDS